MTEPKSVVLPLHHGVGLEMSLAKMFGLLKRSLDDVFSIFYIF